MKTTELIHNLSAQLKPLQTVKFTAWDFMKVLTAGLFCVLASVFILGLRTDLSEKMLSPRFILEGIGLAALAVLSILAAFRLSIPSERQRHMFRIPLAVFSLILLSSVYSFFVYAHPLLYFGHGFACVSKIGAVSILPAAILFYFVRKAAVLKRKAVGVVILLSGAAFGLLGVHLTCSDSTALHIVLWHVVPAIALMGLGAFLAHVLLKKI